MAYSKKDIGKELDKFTSKKEFYIYTLVMFPTILIAIVAQYIENYFVRAIVMALLVFFQAIILKGIIENK